MKILLVALNAKYVHSNLAVYDLYSYANKKQDYRDYLFVREFTINNDLDHIMQALYSEKADVIAFSCYIWNIKEIITISKELSKINPELKIWLGGPEVSYNSFELLSECAFISGIICGEGEESFSELISYWINKDRELKNIKGIVYRDDKSEIILNEARPLISMDDIPFIYDDFSLFKNKIIYYESSRGCPFSCSYCLSSIDKSVRFRSDDLVESELQKFLDAKIPQIKFIDRTFNCNKARALKIWKYICEHDNEITNFHFEISADLIGEEELELFSKMRPGLIQLEIGLQSTNDNTIHEIRRSMNIEKLKENMLKIRSFNNIHQHLDLIAGLPYEDFESFKKSFCDAYEMKPHQLQLGFLKVLKGSYMETMSKDYELLYHDEQPYEIMSTKWISYEEIVRLKLVEEMVEIYHNSGQFINTLNYLLKFFETPFSFFYELGSFYKNNNLMNIGFKREARYTALRDFAKDYLTEMETLDYLLSYDFYLRENSKTRPSWSEKDPIDKKTYQGFFINSGNRELSLLDIWGDKKYDSKAASRLMHIEPISYKAYEAIFYKGYDAIFSENENIINNVSAKLCTEDSCETIYCIYDYEHRNPLSNDARVYYLSSLC